MTSDENRNQSDQRQADSSQLHQSRLALIGEMTAGIAHDMKNPISVIDIFSQLLRTELETASQLSPSILDKLNRIDLARSKLNKLVQLINRFGRDDEDMFPGNDVDQVAENTSLLVDHRLKMGSAELRIEKGSEVKRFYGCSSQIEQVLVNLINNAVDALEGQAGERRVCLRFEIDPASKDRLNVSVGDNGPGIAPEIRQKIFNAFFTTKPADKGTGLGLHICKQIIEGHGSTLKLDSEPGRTVFSFQLPLHTPKK